VLLVMGAYTMARLRCGMLDATRRVTFDNTRLLWHYTVAQGIVILAAIEVLPRMV
jgi:cytochrome c oxidase subunit I+III